MSPRQKLVLKCLIEEYMKSRQPVSSKTLASKKKLKVSSATLRIEMSRLAKEGYLRKLYFSSGKIPTVKAYRFYLENCCQPKISLAQERRLIQVFKLKKEEEILQRLIESIAEISHSLAFLFWEDFFLFQGLKYLLKTINPLHKRELLRIAQAVEEGFDFAKKTKTKNLEIYFGDEIPCPGAENLSIIVAKISKGNLGAIGSLGMNYPLSIGLLQKARELLETKL